MPRPKTLHLLMLNLSDVSFGPDLVLAKPKSWNEIINDAITSIVCYGDKHELQNYLDVKKLIEDLNVLRDKPRNKKAREKLDEALGILFAIDIKPIMLRENASTPLSEQFRPGRLKNLIAALENGSDKKTAQKIYHGTLAHARGEVKKSKADHKEAILKLLAI